jgi:hypothetical protein
MNTRGPVKNHSSTFLLYVTKRIINETNWGGGGGAQTDSKVVY